MRICIVGEMSSGHVPQRASLIRKLGHDVVVGAPERRSRGLAGYLGWLWRYYLRLRDEPVDLVHVHYAIGIGAWLSLVAGRRPLVVTIMGGDVLSDEQSPLGWPARALVRLLLRHADRVTSKSDYLTAELRRLGVKEERIVKLIWGIDAAAFHAVDAAPLRHELGLAAEDTVIFSPRALQPLYNIDLIVAAMPGILARVPTAKLLLSEYAADASYRGSIGATISRLGIGASVRFVGVIPHARMAEFFSLAAASVSIPSSDGLPQSMLEAAACGTSNIVSKLACYREFLRPDETAVLVDLDPQAVAEGVCRVLLQESLRARLVAEGRRLAGDADTAAQLRLLDREYRLLAETSDRRRMSVGTRLRAAGLLALFLAEEWLAAWGWRLISPRRGTGASRRSWPAENKR